MREADRNRGPPTVTIRCVPLPEDLVHRAAPEARQIERHVDIPERLEGRDDVLARRHRPIQEVRGDLDARQRLVIPDAALPKPECRAAPPPPARPARGARA